VLRYAFDFPCCIFTSLLVRHQFIPSKTSSFVSPITTFGTHRFDETAEAMPVSMHHVDRYLLCYDD